MAATKFGNFEASKKTLTLQKAIGAQHLHTSQTTHTLNLHLGNKT